MSWRLVPLLLALLASCGGTRPTHAVLFASDPPGALVWVDGERSGFATPCTVSLIMEKPHKVELEMPGFQTAVRFLVPDGYEQGVLWKDMNIGHRTFHFPLWLNIDSFFIPVRTMSAVSPNRLFVRLKRTADLETFAHERGFQDDESGPAGPATRPEGVGDEPVEIF